MTEAAVEIGVLGLGRLGACLARALHAAGVRPLVLASRQRATAERVAASLDSDVQVVDAEAIAQAANLLLLAVPDVQVSEVCASLPLTAAHAVVHLSGVLGLEALTSAAARGARVGALHPLQAFPKGAGVDRFVGIHAGVEASDAQLAAELERLARALGAEPFSLRGVDRARYHAAAVFASNFVVALHAAAAEVWQRAGLPVATARPALAPLTRGAASAISERELSLALTGPVARGDVQSVESHLRVLQDDPARLELYRALARELLRLPLELSPAARSALMHVLGEAG